MKAVKYDPKNHYEQICRWSEKHGSPHPPAHLLPELGRIVPDYAAVFLYRTDSGVAFVENLLTNPDQKREDLEESMDAVISAIERDAVDESFSFLWGATFIPGVMERAKKHGFKIQKERYKLMTKGIK